MPPLLYRPDFDSARQRLAAWWRGDDIGRPAMLLLVPRNVPLEPIPERPEPEGWLTHYSIRDLDYRLYLGQKHVARWHYLAEAIPDASPDLAPNTLALFLGCNGVEQRDTVWCEPCIESPETARFELDPDNRYWRFCIRLLEALQAAGEGRFLVSFPDLIEGLDTLAAMRGTEDLLVDLIERPDWVHASLAAITQRYFEVYDNLYDRIHDDSRGSVCWAWAPGRMTKLQCDMSAMLSPAMFDAFMIPVLREMTARVDFCMYHWDGPGALPHHDSLLALPDLDMIQWVPGAGVEPVDDPRWWPLYHKTVDAGKTVYLHSCSALDNLRALKREFGKKLNRFLIGMGAATLAEANVVLAVAES